MVNRFLKYYFRVFRRHAGYTVLNSLGLSVGIGLSILILLYIQSELTYDQHIPHYERIYRVNSNFDLPDEIHSATSGVSLAHFMNETFEGLEAVSTVLRVGDNILMKYGGQSFFEDRVFLADENYFDVFETNFIFGDTQIWKDSAKSVVISEAFAQKIFGEKSPVGAELSTNNSSYVIAAVVPTPKENTHIKFDVLFKLDLSKLTELELKSRLWAANSYTYLKLQEWESPQKILDQFPEFYQSYMCDVAESMKMDYHIDLIRLDKIHLDGSTVGDLPKGNKMNLLSFGGLGILILVMAIVNYINLATAKARTRISEAGIRRALGASKKQLVFLYLGESMVLTLFSFGIALIGVELLTQMPWFIELLNKRIQLQFQGQELGWLSIILIMLLVGFLAGIYPAVFLSRTTPIQVLKGLSKDAPKSLFFRKGMVTFQMVVSVGVVVIGLLMSRQIDFLSVKNLGFEDAGVMYIPMRDTSFNKRYSLFKERLLEDENIKGVTVSRHLPGEVLSQTVVFGSADKTAERLLVQFLETTDGYFKTLGIDLVEGNTFTGEAETDYEVVVNEAFLRSMQWKSAEGKSLYFGGANDTLPLIEAKISGVCKDYNVGSLYQPIEPLVIILQEKAVGNLLIKADMNNRTHVLKTIEENWAKIDPERPLEISNLEDVLMEPYATDQIQSKIMRLLMMITILISGMGLLGLASFSTSQRTKEIAVRKVLGAEKIQIVWLVLKEVSQIVIIALLLSFPIAYLLFKSWVSNFSYFAPIDFSLFFTTGFAAFLLSYFMVSYHAFKVALKSPVIALRYE